MTVRTADFLVIGGGIIGVTVALELKRRHPSATIVLLEKESACGTHASGRNSGVLHAGRAELNGVELNEVTVAEARDLEPRAKTIDRALFSPTTATVDPIEVLQALVGDATAAGVSISNGVSYMGRRASDVDTTAGVISAGYVINASGLYADRLARDYGFAEQVRILPFKGLYLLDAAGAESVRRHIYPVPELKYPFLGVHFTVTADGKAKIGPTAIPAFWREHYSGFSNFNLGELWETLSLESSLFTRNSFQFRNLARREIGKYSKRRLAGLASALVDGLNPESDWRWGPAGIRAQLVDIARRQLVMDFRVEADGSSLHVLNAVSPAFTCSLPFADHLVDRIEDLAGTDAAGVEIGPADIRHGPDARSSGRVQA